MYSREEALALLNKYLPPGNLFKHLYAVEAVMRALARGFKENEEEWGLVGLLHDLDYEETKNEPWRHGLVSGEILTRIGLKEELVYAIKCHYEQTGLKRKSLLDKALYAADPLTGLIVAGALIRPGKKLAEVDAGFLLNRFAEKSFAKGAKREQIASCVEFGLSLEEFLKIGLHALQGISYTLGL